MLSLALALSAAHAVPAAAQSQWKNSCATEAKGPCEAVSAQCGLQLSVGTQPTTEGSWVGIFAVPIGWDKVVVKVMKGTEAATVTINAPQLPGMAFGREDLRDLMLAGTSATIEVFQGDRITKSCQVSLEGLAGAYKDAQGSSPLRQ